MRDDTAWQRGRRLFDEGAHWEAHEAWEAGWATAEGTERRFLAGSILLTAALHKARVMDSPRGGRRNYAKALRHLALVPDRFGGVDVREFEARVHRALRDPEQRPTVPLAREAGADAARAAGGTTAGGCGGAADRREAGR